MTTLPWVRLSPGLEDEFPLKVVLLFRANKSIYQKLNIYFSHENHLKPPFTVDFTTKTSIYSGFSNNTSIYRIFQPPFHPGSFPLLRASATATIHHSIHPRRSPRCRISRLQASTFHMAMVVYENMDDWMGYTHDLGNHHIFLCCTRSSWKWSPWETWTWTREMPRLFGPGRKVKRPGSAVNNHGPTGNNCMKNKDSIGYTLW